MPAIVFMDILFFPRVLFAFGVPASLAIVLIYLLREGITLQRMICMLALVASMFASVAFGAATGQNLEPVESLKRVIQLTTILIYSFYRFDIASAESSLVKVFRAFYGYIFLVGVFFYSYPEAYESWLATVYPEAMEALPNNFEHFRFAYFFSDPNSAAYFVCFTLVAYLRLEKSRGWMFVCSVVASLVVVVTQSRGAYVALLFILLNFIFLADIRWRTKFCVALLLGLAVAVLVNVYFDEIELAVNVFEVRFSQEEDLGGGRVDKYLYFLQNLNIFPFGSGYHLRRDGIEFRPHSDLIRLNLAYGVLAVPALMVFVWPRVRAQILLFVVFAIPFLINTVIDDYRLFPMYFLLMTILRQRSESVLIKRSDASRLSIRGEQ
jgi:hypothetical protein